MCGISASIINLNSEYKKSISFYRIFKFLRSEDYSKTISMIKSLRCNEVYIELVKNNPNFLNNFKNLKSLLLTKIKKKKDEVLDDILWILENDILKKADEIRYKIKENNLFVNNNTIVFLKNFLDEIENLNYLETRGRDSASISFSLIGNKSFYNKKENSKNSKTVSIDYNQNSKKKFVLNVTIKYANKIGYIGENTKNLEKLLNKKKILKNIDFNKIFGFTFFTHTRWATVGPVNISNCHPLIVKNSSTNFYSMNGDISNFSQLFEKKIISKSNVDRFCENDLIILDEYFKRKKFSDLEGSFVVLNHNLNNPLDMFIFKKGSQGLYISQDNNQNIVLSSDVYGLINRCSKFNILRNNVKTYTKNIFKKKKFFEFPSFKYSDLSTRDLNKRGYESYFLKEINDTGLFLKRTIENYIDKKKFELKKIKIFTPKINRKLKEGKIKNIIFTGMGSCYTAAVGISKYLSNKIKIKNKINIKIEASIASEGSGFYLKRNMNDTIIIVLAQSGTTIDTNVFAKKARSAGAYTVSIVNKKQGDVTYIVEKNYYLGNGRDVELSVPSTKTFTCHLIMGYILSEYILRNFGIEDKFFAKKILKISNQKFISNKILDISKKLKQLIINPISYKNWIVAYDDSVNSFLALEYRIKLSECCYKSIPYLNISQINKLNPKRNLIFYVGNKGNEFNLDNSNQVLKITNQIPKSYSKIIKVKENDFIANSIVSALAIQLTAHKVALEIDKISKKNNILNNKNLNFAFNLIDRENILKLSKNEILNKTKDQLKRPIDTIKHQAKTITVGALRNNSKFVNRTQKIQLKASKVYNGYKKLFYNLKKDIYLSSDDENDVNKYFLCNIIEKCNEIYSEDKQYFFNDSKYKHKKDTNCSFLNLGNYFQKVKNNNDINLINPTFHSLIKTMMKSDKYTMCNEQKLQQIKHYLKNNKKKYLIDLDKTFCNYNNIKFLGSGVNYLVAKKFAFEMSKITKRSIAYDVIENHKHIDISSEALLLIFTSNINRKGFQIDVVSEVEKFLSHDNNVILFTNLENNLYDKFQKSRNKLPKNIKLPFIDELYSPVVFDYYFKNFVK